MDFTNEILGLSSTHGSYVISSSASDTAKAYYNDLANTFDGKIFYYDDKNIAESICDYVNRQSSFSKENECINYSTFVDPSWKEKVQSGDFETIPNLVDADNDGLYDIEEINWELYDGSNTYYDYADSKYTGSDKAKKGIEQLFGGTVVKTKSFIPFVSDPDKYDTDRDGISDEDEIESKETDPNNADTDNDGLIDGEEIRLSFDPTTSNFDGDSYSDLEEYNNHTDPYVYDYTWMESSKEYLKGLFLGDFNTADTVPELLGQVTGSFIPFGADIRDYFANTIVNENTKAALWNEVCAFLDALPGLGVMTDGSKIIPKLGRFAVKHSDDSASVVKVISKVSEDYPSIMKSVSKSDELTDAIKKSATDRNLTRESLEKIVKCADEAGVVLNKTSDIIKKSGPVRDTGKNVWKNYGPCKRGDIIDEFLNEHSLGNGLGTNFPVFDRLVDGNLISTKSIDLSACTYKDPKKLEKRLQAYIDKINDFENKYPKVKTKDGFSWGETPPLHSSDYKNKLLELVIPDMPISDEQAKIINAFVDKYDMMVVVLKG